MKKKLLLFATITILLIHMITPLTTITYSQQPAYLRFLFLYAPGFSLDKALNITESLKFLENATFKAYVKPVPPYTLAFNEVILVNGTWDLSRAIVLDNNTALLANNSYVPLYKLMPEQLITNIWGSLDTMFLGTASVDPQIHSRTMNPYYNETDKVINPELFIIPINGTARWEQLNTTVKLSVTDQYLILTVENYVKSIKLSKESNITPILKFNITGENISVEPGIYYLKFRVLRINETHVVLFTPGTRRADQWFSDYFEKFDKPVAPRIPLEYLKYMDKDDLEWLVNEIIGFYKSMLNTAYKYRAAIINFVEYPLIYDLWMAYIQGYIDQEQLGELEELAYKGVSELINTTKSMIGENITAIIYSPFTFNNYKETLSLNGLQYIEPGLYMIKGDIDQIIAELTGQGISFSTIPFNDKTLLLINDPKYCGISKGQLIVYGQGLRRIFATLTLQPTNIASFIASLTRGYGVGLANAINEITLINLKVQSLNDEINTLQNKLESINQTLFNVNQTLSMCKAENINLTDQIIDYKNKINEYMRREQQALLYATIGSVSILVIIILLYIIGTRGLIKKKH